MNSLADYFGEMRQELLDYGLSEDDYDEAIEYLTYRNAETMVRDLVDGSDVDDSELTPDQWDALYAMDMADYAESVYVDPAEMEEISSIIEEGFDGEVLRDCD